MTLEEAINRYERQTKELYNAIPCDGCAFNTCKKEHRQLSKWLKELKESRKIIDFFLQTFVDFDLDMCCEDLMSDDKEQFICEENCNNKTKACWLRWAKLKVREVNADEDSD